MPSSSGPAGAGRRPTAPLNRPGAPQQGGPHDQNRPSGADPARAQGEASPIDSVNLRGEVAIGSKEADLLLGDLRNAILKDSGDVFAEIIKERTGNAGSVADAMRSNPKSAGYASTEDLIDSLIAGARQYIDMAISRANTKGWRGPSVVPGDERGDVFDNR